MYLDQDGFGHSYNSEITGGAAGDGHNNVVTRTTDETYRAMVLANHMQNRHMSKMANYMQKDIKTYCQKPQVSFFFGHRVQYKEIGPTAQEKR